MDRMPESKRLLGTVMAMTSFDQYRVQRPKGPLTTGYRPSQQLMDVLFLSNDLVAAKMHHLATWIIPRKGTYFETIDIFTTDPIKWHKESKQLWINQNKQSFEFSQRMWRHRMDTCGLSQHTDLSQNNPHPKKKHNLETSEISTFCSL